MSRVRGAWHGGPPEAREASGREQDQGDEFASVTSRAPHRRARTSKRTDPGDFSPSRIHKAHRRPKRVRRAARARKIDTVARSHGGNALTVRMADLTVTVGCRHP